MTKILIINNTNLLYYHIGEMIDYINETHKNDTNYYGKLSYYEIQLNEKCYKITIQTLKKYTKYIIEEEK